MCQEQSEPRGEWAKRRLERWVHLIMWGPTLAFILNVTGESHWRVLSKVVMGADVCF